MTERSGPSRRELPDFTREEFERRVERARELMTAQRLDGVMVCSEPNLEYLSGFVTQFAWNTPTRPWYFVLPRLGEPVGVIPELGAANWLRTSWCKNILTWPSPRPADEGLNLLAGAIDAVPRTFGRFGMELGPETRIGMTVADFLHLREAIHSLEVADAVPVLRELRHVKSAAEVARIRHICRIASRTFANLPGLLRAGDSEREIVRTFGAEMLRLGADKAPFIAIGTGRGGYPSVIMGPTGRRVRPGDILNIDTGGRYGGYSCDFNRNFAIGTPPPPEARRLYDILWRATEAGIGAAVPGATAEGLFYAQAAVLEEAGITLGNVGRFGHGLGKVLTEYPSNKPGDRTVLRPGTVITIEPSAMFGRGRVMVHEEDLVVTEDGPVLLSRRARREMPVIAL